MVENFSKIEDYLQKRLDEKSKKEFEKALNSDSELAKQFNFYKKLQSQKPEEFSPIEFDRKILPEINSINFTEKQRKKGTNTSVLIGVLLLFTTIATLWSILNGINNTDIAILNKQKDSLIIIYKKQIAEFSLKLSEHNDTLLTHFQKQIAEKERQIESLETNNFYKSKQIAALDEEKDSIEASYKKRIGKLLSFKSLKSDEDKIDSLERILLEKEKEINQIRNSQKLIDDLTVKLKHSKLILSWKENTDYIITLLDLNKDPVYDSKVFVKSNLEIDVSGKKAGYLIFITKKAKKITLLADFSTGAMVIIKY